MIDAVLFALAVQASLAVVPERVCVDPRTGYPNLDLVLTNGADKPAEITEIRGMVFDASGALLERRLVWQDALRAVRPDAEVPANGQAVVFNPMRFNHAAPGRRMVFEVDLNQAGTKPLSVEVVPVDCAAGQPKLILPISGRVLVYDGYDALSHHRRSDFRGDLADAMKITGNFQRFGMDLVVIDEQGALWRGEGKKTSDWLGWGKPVRAAGAGIVAAVHNDQPDNVEIGTVDKWKGPEASNPMSPYGNYVLLDHGGGEFTLYGHMKQGSVAVATGQKVAAGDRIGSIGNSGSSGGVHLHWERRRGRGLGLSDIETQPIFVSDVDIVGASAGTGAPLAIDTGDVLIGRLSAQK